MRIYQIIHKYPPHIPKFEAKYSIDDNTDITFDELRKLLIIDGYASCYILQPALDHKSDEVFFTIWNYERLQFIWAKEHGIRTCNLNEIKLAQIKYFKPDIFYNMSPSSDRNFIDLLKREGVFCKTVCWNAIIESIPKTFPSYDVHLSLHRPFVEYWEKLGLKAFEFQPGIPSNWNYINNKRSIDVLFYGQYYDGIFSNRNQIIDKLLKYKNTSNYNIEIHLQMFSVVNLLKKVIFSFLKFKLNIKVLPFIIARLRAKGPIYGNELYSRISDSKIIVNAYGNNNQLYKSNMRLFESIGNGAFLISETGRYPEGLIPEQDFYTYQGFDELKEKIEFVLSNWKIHQKIALATSEKVRLIFSKEKQWLRFKEIVESIL